MFSKQSSNKKTYTMALMAVLLSLSLILGYVEHLVPILPAVPGVKLGLSNIVLLLCLYALGAKEAFLLMIIKVFLSTMLFSGLGSMIYSLAGGVASLLAMILAKKIMKLSIIGTSVLGGVFHNIAQVAVAILVVHLPMLVYYMAILMIAGVITGILTGFIAQLLLKHLKVFTKKI